MKKSFDISINFSNFQEIYHHLTLCDKLFSPPLSTTVNILGYSKKISEFATRFEAWDHEVLVGLIAVYANRPDTKKAFITNVSVLKNYQKNGIASVLMDKCINHCIKNSFSKIELEVNINNISAIDLYKGYNFVIIKLQDNHVIMSKNI